MATSENVLAAIHEWNSQYNGIIAQTIPEKQLQKNSHITDELSMPVLVDDFFTNVLEFDIAPSE